MHFYMQFILLLVLKVHTGFFYNHFKCSSTFYNEKAKCHIKSGALDQQNI